MEIPKMKNQIFPSFFKIMLDDANPNLPLPPAFVKKHFSEDGFPENPVLVTEYGGKWEVEIGRVGGKFCFVNGWLNFVRDTKTEIGDFLVFCLIGKSTFQVSIFGPTACAKDLTFLTPTPTHCHKCACNCGGSGISNVDLKNKVKIEEEDVDDEIKNEEDEEDEDAEEKEYEDMDEDENDVEDDDKEEEKDEDYEDGDDDIKEEDEDEEEEDDDDDYVKETNNVQPFDWREECLISSFEKVLTKSHNYTMVLPKSFVTETGLDSKGKILVRNKELKKWSVKIRRWADGRYYLGQGWLRFWKHNKLMEGDTCTFKYTRGEDGRSGLLDVEVVKKVAPRKRGRPRLNATTNHVSSP